MAPKPNMSADLPQVELLWLSGHMTYEKFMNYAISVYFSPDFSDAEYIIVNSGFYWLFQALTAVAYETGLPNSLSSEELAKQAVRCRENVEVALSRLRFHLPNSIDYVTALGFAVSQIRIEVVISSSQMGYQVSVLSLP
jgi:hypothetical protein